MGKDTNDSVKYCTYPQKRPKKHNLGNSRQAWLTLVPGKIVYHVLLKHISEQMKSVMKKANMDLAKINHVWSTSVPSVMAAFVWSGESSGCHLPQRWKAFDTVSHNMLVSRFRNCSAELWMDLKTSWWRAQRAEVNGLCFIWGSATNGALHRPNPRLVLTYQWPGGGKGLLASVCRWQQTGITANMLQGRSAIHRELDRVRNRLPGRLWYLTRISITYGTWEGRNCGKWRGQTSCWEELQKRV